VSKPTTTSSGTFPPPKLTQIDELLRIDHSYLEHSDECYFLGEYTPRQGFAFSPTNDLILNFKKKPRERGQSHKVRAIDTVAKTFGKLIRADYLRATVLVPTPPSKHHDDSDYDDRVLRMLAAIVPTNGKSTELQVRELVVQTKTLPSAHDSTQRLRPEQIAAACIVKTELLNTTPDSIAVFDDLLVTGARFKAMQSLLVNDYPKARIVGFFIARRVPD
jgi:predicted amidophosphoribosyltransferase